MTILILILIIALLLLSWKYILKLEPAGVFAGIWIVTTAIVLLLQNYIILRYYGIIYILSCIILFVFGSISCDTFYNPTPISNKLVFRKERALPILLILFVGAMVNPLYSIVLHGFSLKALLSLQDILNVNKSIAEDRYYTGGVTNTVNQIFLVFCYAAPLLGGFCYRWVNKLTKTICLLTLIPGMFIALTQSMKLGMVTGFILWFTGYIVSSYSYGIPIRLKLRNIIRLMIILLGFFFILFLSMVLRTGEISPRTIIDISQRFITYALGQFTCFEMWFTSHEPITYSFGTKTFLGIASTIGLEDKMQGIYQEYYQIGQNGFYGIGNIFTIFRSLIEDFGETGALLIMFLMGFCSKLSFKAMMCRKRLIMNQVITTAFYAYLFWSFATSFFAYLSYFAMFFMAYFLFHYLQTEHQP